MPIEQITRKTIHLEGTSETDEVPVQAAINRLQYAIQGLTQTEQDSAVVSGWRGVAVQYEHRMSDIDLAQARLMLLASGLRSGKPLSLEDQAFLLSAAGL